MRLTLSKRCGSFLIIFRRLRAESSSNLARGALANATEGAAAEVFLNALHRAWYGRSHRFDLKLPAKARVFLPRATDDEAFVRGQHWQHPADGDVATLVSSRSHRPVVVRIVKNYLLDLDGKFFPVSVGGSCGTGVTVIIHSC